MMVHNLLLRYIPPRSIGLVLIAMMVACHISTVQAADLARMNEIMNTKNVVQVFDVNSTTILGGKNVTYIPGSISERPAYELWTIEVHTEQETLIPTDGKIFDAALSPVDARIAYVSENNVLWIIHPSSGEKSRVYDGVIPGFSWSPDGTKIAFPAEVVVDGVESLNIFVAETTGTVSVTQLTSGLTLDEMPRWSPDGTQIVFLSGRTGFASLWIMNADGGNVTQLTNTNITSVQSALDSGSQITPAPGIYKGLAWSKEERIYLHSGSALLALPASPASSEKIVTPLSAAQTTAPQHITPTGDPIGIFTIDGTATLWVQQNGSVNISTINGGQ